MWKEIRSPKNFYVYGFIAATKLNWQIERAEKLEGCSSPKKIKKALAGADMLQSRLEKEWGKLYPISSVPN